MSKEVGAGGRFDIFLDSGSTIQPWLLAVFDSLSIERTLAHYTFWFSSSSFLPIHHSLFLSSLQFHV